MRLGRKGLQCTSVPPPSPPLGRAFHFAESRLSSGDFAKLGVEERCEYVIDSDTVR